MVSEGGVAVRGFDVLSVDMLHWGFMGVAIYKLELAMGYGLPNCICLFVCA